MRKFIIILMVLGVLFSPVIGGTFEKEFSVTPGKKLTVDVQTGGSLEIRGWEKSSVKFIVSYRGSRFEEGMLDFYQDDEGVRMEVTNGEYYNNIGLNFEIQVPSKFDLDINTMGGSIMISGVEGVITGQTMGGSLLLDNLKGKLKMTTMGGEIVLKEAEVDGNLKTMGGEVLFEDVVGDIEGTSMGGAVTFRNVKIKDSTSQAKEGVVKISTMGGEIKVDNAPLGADVHTMGGEIRVKNAKVFVKARTMGGEITIEQVDGWIDATTMGGEITAVMVGDASKGKRDVDLSSKGGDIDLTLPAGISADFDIRLDYTKNSSQDYKIHSDFDIQIEEAKEWDYLRGNPRKTISGKGKIKGGQHRIRINTINGDIWIRKGK
jgi:DUF4097 and DUF4098 domain-containing protein YvlB